MSWNSLWQTGPRGRRAPRSWPRCRACARCARRSIARRSPWPRSIARSRRCSGSWSDGAPSSRSSPPTTPRWRTSSYRSPAGSCAMRDHPLVQLTLARMREFYREPEAIFWVFGFPIVLAFALGIAFRNRGPGELRVAVLRGAGDSVLAAALARAPGLTAAVLDSAEARLQLRTGRVALLVAPGDPVVYRYDSTRTELGRAGPRARPHRGGARLGRGAAAAAHGSRRAARRARRSGGVPVRLDPHREPAGPPRSGRSRAARARPRRRGARRGPADHRAGLALHRLPHSRPARHESHGERAVGRRILGRAGPHQEAAQALHGDADAPQSLPPLVHLVPARVPVPRGRGARGLRLVDVPRRGPGFVQCGRVHHGARRPLVRRAP